MKASERLRQASQALTEAEEKDPSDYLRAAIQYAYELGRADQELSLSKQKVDRILASTAKVADDLYVECMKNVMVMFGLDTPFRSDTPTPTPEKPRLVLIQGGKQ